MTRGCALTPKKILRAEYVHPDDGRECNRRECRRNVDLRAVREHVVDIEQEQAEQQKPAMLAEAKCQIQTPKPAPGEKQKRCRPISIHDRYFRSDGSELELDREPRRAPDQNRNDVERQIAHGFSLQSSWHTAS